MPFCRVDAGRIKAILGYTEGNPVRGSRAAGSLCGERLQYKRAQIVGVGGCRPAVGEKFEPWLRLSVQATRLLGIKSVILVPPKRPSTVVPVQVLRIVESF